MPSRSHTRGSCCHRHRHQRGVPHTFFLASSEEKAQKAWQYEKLFVTLPSINQRKEFYVNNQFESGPLCAGQSYAREDNLSVKEWVALFIKRFVPNKKKEYKMKKIEELSPELQTLIGFAKTSADDDNDINGDKTRMEYLQEKCYSSPIARNILIMIGRFVRLYQTLRFATKKGFV